MPNGGGQVAGNDGVGVLVLPKIFIVITDGYPHHGGEKGLVGDERVLEPFQEGPRHRMMQQEISVCPVEDHILCSLEYGQAIRRR